MKRFIKGIGVALLAIITMTGCGMFVDDDRVAIMSRGYFVDGHAVVKAVEKQGYQQVEIVDQHVFFAGLRGCGGEDAAVFQMSALNVRGERVDLTACAGWPWKGVTVRTY